MHAQPVCNVILRVVALVVLAILLHSVIQREGHQRQPLLLVAQDAEVACR